MKGLILRKTGTRFSRPIDWLSGLRRAVSLVILLALATGLKSAAGASAVSTNSASSPPEVVPVSSREFYNVGTRKLKEGKLREAEAFLQNVLNRQEESLQSPALFNLGHVRFGQGIEELKKAGSPQGAVGRGRAAADRGSQAIGQADEALASEELQKMIAAYMNGRGAQKDMKAAAKAVSQALGVYGSILRKWQRASGDFKGAAELSAADTNAQHNAEVVDRVIAKLVDSIRQLQEGSMAVQQRQKELSEKMNQLKGKIPAQMMPPGAGDEGDDEGEKGKEEKEGEEGQERLLEKHSGHQEGPSREGEEISISPEEAGWLLEGYNLDLNRRLPMSQGEPGQPKDSNRRNW